jgi:lipopolysaccharide transport system ATP-binding protein
MIKKGGENSPPFFSDDIAPETVVSSLLTVNHLSKCYRLYARPVDRFKELLLGRQYHEEFWAVRGVSLTVEKGVSLGILGENGAGKSTLLKLITGALTPTTGTVVVHGRVASIIELGMGFHPDFSGIENLFVGGALLGFSHRQMEEKIPYIQEFSELGESLYRPLKHYSTGMGMRLSFSLAVSVEPDLLIVDEALAVGDGYFQKKCIDRIRAFQERGGNLLLCSHSLYTVSLLCQEAVWLRTGQVEAFGPSPQVIAAYEAHLNARESKLSEQPWREHYPGGTLRLVKLSGGRGQAELGRIMRGDEVRVAVEWESDRAERPFHLGVAVDRVDNLTCFASSTLKDGLPPFTGQTTYRVTLRFPAVPLTNGSFRVMIFLLDEHGVHVYDHRAADPVLVITNEEKEWGICYLDHVWERG